MDQEQLSGTGFEVRSLDYVPQAMWIPRAQQAWGAAPRARIICACGAATTGWIFLGRKTRRKQRAVVAWRIVRLKLQTQDPPSAARVWRSETLVLGISNCKYLTAIVITVLVVTGCASSSHSHGASNQYFPA